MTASVILGEKTKPPPAKTTFSIRSKELRYMPELKVLFPWRERINGAFFQNYALHLRVTILLTDKYS
jgi:hypothetical protein